MKHDVREPGTRDRTADVNARRPRVLYVSNLYPNPAEPTRGTFNHHTVQGLKRFVDLSVLVPAPAFPLRRICLPETRDDDGVPVRYVRTFHLPGVLRSRYGDFCYRSLRPVVAELHRESPFDVLFASWVYPDGYAVMRLSRELDVPFVVHALGSDIHQYLGRRDRRDRVLRTLREARAVVCVSEELRGRVVTEGIEPEKVQVVYDGVDGDLFRPGDRVSARRRLGLDERGKVALFVGSLVRVKGADLLVEAAGQVRERIAEKLQLALVGAGKELGKLRRQVVKRGLEDVVRFAGSRPHEEIVEWMRSADVVCIPSRAEGLPNVALEALATGRPVVASGVGGLAEVIRGDEAGMLVEPGNVKELARALSEALTKQWDQERLRAAVRGFSWAEHSRRIAAIIGDVWKGK